MGSRVYSRWLVLLSDLAIMAIAFYISWGLIKKLEGIHNHLLFPFFYCGTSLVVFWGLQVHRRIVRYTNTDDLLRVIFAVFICNIVFFGICNVIFRSRLGNPALQLADILLVNFFIATCLLLLVRLMVKDLFKFVAIAAAGVRKENVLILGTSKTAILLKNAIDSDTSLGLHVRGFLDTQSDIVNKSIEHISVYPAMSLARLNMRLRIRKVLIPSELSLDESKVSLMNECIKMGIQVVKVPDTSQWINSRPDVSQFKDVRIEDLLQRPSIRLSERHISEELSGKRILVTGAAGSIGSEIVRQVLAYNPSLVILCDQAETPLHSMQLQLENYLNRGVVKIIVGDVKNAARMRGLFADYKPQVVFHAAAYKHVPMMEDNPTEAIITNVGGTRVMADLAIQFGVEKFVMISTDKAVRPTNVMGASKRMAEMYIQSLNNLLSGEYVSRNQRRTRFITTRFGNVLGSNGSVIPRFKEQIAAGGPVTVTHPEITRYFMTIPEAVQLVLEAAVMGKGAEIFLFDMGKPVKIVELAENMIRLSGLTPGKDIPIVFTGLRPGEKLYEELLNSREDVLPTYNDNIKISRTIPVSYESVNAIVDELLHLSSANDVDNMVLIMKRMIPDFVSNNSSFQRLDLPVITQ